MTWRYDADAPRHRRLAARAAPCCARARVRRARHDRGHRHDRRADRARARRRSRAARRDPALGLDRRRARRVRRHRRRRRVHDRARDRAARRRAHAHGRRAAAGPDVRPTPAIIFTGPAALDALLGRATRDTAGPRAGLERWGNDNPTGIAHDHVGVDRNRRDHGRAVPPRRHRHERPRGRDVRARRAEPRRDRHASRSRSSCPPRRRRRPDIRS